jgi:hypothetical protein
VRQRRRQWRCNAVLSVWVCLRAHTHINWYWACAASALPGDRS